MLKIEGHFLTGACASLSFYHLRKSGADCQTCTPVFLGLTVTGSYGRMMAMLRKDEIGEYEVPCKVLPIFPPRYFVFALFKKCLNSNEYRNAEGASQFVIDPVGKIIF